jgi:RimJ/RimL family protein N-acetyltransferase
MLTFRKATIDDARLYFEWANDETVRKNSFNQEVIEFEDHVKWFEQKLRSPACHFYIFFNEQGQPVGQVRIDKQNEEIIIGVSVDAKYRGQDLAWKMLSMACGDYLGRHPDASIKAYIKESNAASVKAFKKAGFENEDMVEVNGSASYKLKKETK